MTQERFFALRPAVFLGLALFLAGASTGCNGPRQSPTLAAASAPRPVAMQGEGRFFDGQIVTKLFISRGFERNGPRKPDGRPQDSFDQIDLPDATDKDYAESIAKIVALQIRGSPMPPVTLRLNLTNQSAQAADVGFVEVNSDLGNFAVQPDHLVLAAGQTAEPEAMNSHLGILGADFPVKVVLRLAGKTESQLITVKSLFTPEGKRK